MLVGRTHGTNWSPGNNKRLRGGPFDILIVLRLIHAYTTIGIVYYLTVIFFMFQVFGYCSSGCRFAATICKGNDKRKSPSTSFYK